MPVPDFLNLARFRDYPFVEGSSTFSTWETAWFLDCGFTLGSEAKWVPSTSNRVQLTSIARTGSNITLTFIAGPVSFTFTTTATVTFATTLTTIGTGLSGTDARYGFAVLQVGDLSTVPSGTMTAQATVLPTLVQSLYRHQVTSLNIANVDTASLLIECDNFSCVLNSTLDLINPPEAITEKLRAEGDLYINGGQFVQVGLVPDAGLLLVTVNKDPDKGTELPCNSPSLYLNPYSDLVACNEAIYSINGVPPESQSHTFVFEGGNAVRIVPDPVLPHTLNIAITPRVAYDLAETTPCQTESSSSSSSGTPRSYHQSFDPIFVIGE